MAVTFETLENQSGLEFTDISSELWREYIFLDGATGQKLRIEEPIALNTSKNGHRVLDSSGECHYIINKWIAIRWKPRKNRPHFVR